MDYKVYVSRLVVTWFCVLILGFFSVPSEAQLIASDADYSQTMPIARNKTVYSSTTAEVKGPELAIDGKDSECFEADQTDTTPFWLMDFGKTQTVIEVKVTNRADCCADDLNNFKIEVFDSDPRSGGSTSVECFNVQTAIGLGGSMNYKCANNPASGRWLRIQKQTAKLSFCEVEVFAKQPQSDIESLNCMFEETEDLFTDCKLYEAPSSTFKWTKGNMSGIDAKEGLSYIYANYTGADQGGNSYLVSFVITSQKPCVTFWYYVKGNESTLKLVEGDSTLQTKSILWASDGDDLDFWRRAQVQAKGGQRRIVFEATRDGFVAIDDLVITSGACLSRTKVNTSITCDFDDPSGDICNFEQGPAVNADWVWTNQPTPRNDTGPRSPTSYYMYSRGDTGRSMSLVTPKFLPSFLRSCLHFRLHRFKENSTDPGNLFVKVANDVEGGFGTVSPLWTTLQVPPSDKWTDIKQTLNIPLNSVVVFERNGGEADIAIDEVSLNSFECEDVETFRCTFDTGICNFVVQSVDETTRWELRNTGSPSALLGPNKAKTGTRFMYPAFSGKTVGSMATLFSPQIYTDVEFSCLVFWYAMGTDSPSQGSMSVIVADPFMKNVIETVWGVTKGVSSELINHWARAEVTIYTAAPKRILFKAAHAGDDQTLIGLDNVELSKDRCKPEKVVMGFSCDFEDEALCGMGQLSLKDQFDWTWWTGSTPTAGTGPEKDHTTGKGHYLYIEASPPRTTFNKAVLYTPVIRPQFPKSCLTFYYHVHGTDVGSLSVSMDAEGTFRFFDAEKIWMWIGEKSTQWMEASIELETTKMYQLYIEGGRGEGPLGDIAIDDFTVHDRECQHYPSPSCSFSTSICGFLQWPYDDFDWVRVPAGFMQIRMNGNQRAGDKALLVSPLVTTLSNNESCLVFWYHLHGPDIGELSVQVSDPLMKNSTPVWRSRTETGKRWNRVALSINTAGSARFAFVASMGSGAGDMAIDEVDVSIGACPHDRIVTSLKCDFEHPFVCGFQNQANPEDDLDWVRKRGRESAGDVTGLHGDHTTGNVLGHYMFLDASPPRSEGDTARLVSPKIKLDRPRNCLTFWYSLSGRNTDQLSVYALRPDGNSSLWNATGNPDIEWTQASIELQNSTSEFQLVFEGTLGSGPEGDIAIDDFELINQPCASEAESVNCTFSDVGMCGYKQSKMDQLDWTLTDGQTDQMPGKPSADNTTGDGLFLYRGPYRPKTAIVSPALLWDVRENCLHFDYSMVGRTMGSLNVYLARAGMLEERQLLWSRDQENGVPEDWVSASVDFLINHPVQLIFEVVRGPGIYSDIAIDNIKVLPHKCDDEAVVCSFPGDSFCRYSPMTDGGGQTAWKLRKGETPTAGTGPHADHTNGKDGKYIYFESDQAMTKSWIKSGVLNTDSGCLSFWYMMYGEPIGSLTVYEASSDNLSQGHKELWTRSTGTDRQWHYVEVDVKDAPSGTRIYFEATPASEGTKGDIAVDDIGFRNQPCGLTPLPQSPADCNFDKDFCGYSQLLPEDAMHRLWARNRGPTPTAGTGPQEDSPLGFPGHYAYVESDLNRFPNVMSELTSPPLFWSPQKICLKFAYHMQGNETGLLMVGLREVVSGKQRLLWRAMGEQGEGWNHTEVDIDFTAPATLHFLANAIQTEGKIVNNVGLDDVEVTEGTCNPVPFMDDWRFQCDRPTTLCVPGQGTCNTTTLSCDCENDYYGLQCQFPAVSVCATSPCERGQCFNQSSCVCPDKYYGDRCQHQMVHAECTQTKMLINVLPHGFTDLASWNIRYPETAGTSCTLNPVEQVAGASGRGWQGFAGEYLHHMDPCAGSATLTAQTIEFKTYVRQLHVFYDPLGRNPTDTLITVMCNTPNLPPPRLSVAVTELRPVGLLPIRSGRVRTDVEILFKLNIPNREDMTEIKIMQCTVSNSISSVPIVINGCPRYPVAQLLYDGQRIGTEFLVLQVYKRPSDRLSLRFKCLARLCRSRFDFFCYTRPQCFGRQKRSVLSAMEERMNGKNMVEVDYTYTLTD